MDKHENDNGDADYHNNVPIKKSGIGRISRARSNAPARQNKRKSCKQYDKCPCQTHTILHNERSGASRGFDLVALAFHLHLVSPQAMNVLHYFI